MASSSSPRPSISLARRLLQWIIPQHQVHHLRSPPHASSRIEFGLLVPRPSKTTNSELNFANHPPAFCKRPGILLALITNAAIKKMDEDPERRTIRLPQPYRRVGKVVEEIWELTWSAVEKKHPTKAVVAEALIDASIVRVNATMVRGGLVGVEGRTMSLIEHGRVTALLTLDDEITAVSATSASLPFRVAVVAGNVVIVEIWPSNPRLSVLTTFEAKGDVVMAPCGRWCSVSAFETTIYRLPSSEAPRNENHVAFAEPAPTMDPSPVLVIPNPAAPVKEEEPPEPTTMRASRDRISNDDAPSLEPPPPPEVHFVAVGKKTLTPQDEDESKRLSTAVVCRWPTSRILKKYSLDDSHVAEWAMPSVATASAMAEGPTVALGAVGTTTGAVFLWDLGLDICHKVLQHHNAAVTALAFQKHYRLVAAAKDGAIHVYDTNANLVACFRISPVTSLRFLGDTVALALTEQGHIVAFETSILGRIQHPETKSIVWTNLDQSGGSSDVFAVPTEDGHLAVVTAQDLKPRSNLPQLPALSAPSSRQQQRPVGGRSFKPAELTLSNLTGKPTEDDSQMLIPPELDVPTLVDSAIQNSIDFRGRREAQMPTILRNIQNLLGSGDR